MSHVLALGFDKDISVSSGLGESLREAGFLSQDACGADSYAQECLAAARTHVSNAFWFVAMAADGRADLDIVYHLPDAVRSGGLGRLLHTLDVSYDSGGFWVFMYDLGTNSTQVFLDLPLPSAGAILQDWYEKGGPIASALHVFRRN